MNFDAAINAAEHLWARGEAIKLEGLDFTKLDELLDDGGRVKLYPAAHYSQFPLPALRAWAHIHARYGFPTTELIDWLRFHIGTRSAIEIGAGAGDLGIRLGIPMTDSFQQVTNKDTMAVYGLAGIPPTRPPADVLQFDGEQAVRKFKPDIVIASWVTKKYDPRRHDDKGNMYGVRYEYIIERCKTFILIGNMNVHPPGRAFDLPHVCLEFPWLVSRAGDQSKNRIWVWNRPGA